MKETCPHVLVAGKTGLILGMLQAIHHDQDYWRPDPQRLDAPYVGSDASSEHYMEWIPHLPLPCHCEVCYRVCESALREGIRRRIRVEDFRRLNLATVKTHIISNINNGIVSLLPSWHHVLEKKERV